MLNWSNCITDSFAVGTRLVALSHCLLRLEQMRDCTQLVANVAMLQFVRNASTPPGAEFTSILNITRRIHCHTRSKVSGTNTLPILRVDFHCHPLRTTSRVAKYQLTNSLSRTVGIETFKTCYLCASLSTGGEKFHPFFSLIGLSEFPRPFYF